MTDMAPPNRPQSHDAASVRDLAKSARAIAAAPDYDEQAIKDALWAVVDAVLAAPEQGGDAARGRRAGLKPLAETTIRVAFSRRHDSAFSRDLARTVIRDARLWLRLLGRFPYGSR